MGTLRALWSKVEPPFEGEFYSTEDIMFEPYPVRQPGPPIWIGSWGSEAGLRRTARLGDGWLASAYNTTPNAFAAARRRLGDHLHATGKDPDRFPNAIATMFLYVTEGKAAADRILQDILAPTLRRPEAELRQRLLVGSARECAEKLTAYQSAGTQRILLWPVQDELHQLEVFREQVAPLARPSPT